MPPKYSKLATSLGNTAAQAEAMRTAFDRAFTEAMNLDQANIAVKAGMVALREAVKAHGASLDDDTAAGVSNQKAIRDQITLLQQRMEAEVAAGNGTTTAYNQARTAYLAQLEQLRASYVALGFNKAKVDELINAYEALAKPRSTTFTTTFLTVGQYRPPGYGDARSGHSRTGAEDFASLANWAPARFAESQRMALAAAGGGSTSRTGGPAPVTVEQTLNVLLDGAPFRAMVDRAVTGEARRQAWRVKVGRR